MTDQAERADPALQHVRALRLASQTLLAAIQREHPRIVKHLTNRQKAA